MTWKRIRAVFKGLYFGHCRMVLSCFSWQRNVISTIRTKVGVSAFLKTAALRVGTQPYMAVRKNNAEIDE